MGESMKRKPASDGDGRDDEDRSVKSLKDAINNSGGSPVVGVRSVSGWIMCCHQLGGNQSCKSNKLSIF